MRKEHADAFISLPQTVITIHRKHILELAKTSRLPSVYGDKAWTEGGGLMSYGPDTMRIDRRAAIYVDKILKGAKPADLPVEQPRSSNWSSISKPPNRLASQSHQTCWPGRIG